jgi:hypothetical protein
MRYHIFTIALLLMAVVLYAVGMHTGASALVLVGAAFELWFWVRLIRRT